MPRHYESSAAVCPFYKYEERTTQFCDGFETVATVRLSFKDTKSAMKIKNKYCRGTWQDCPLAKTLISTNRG